MADSSVESPHHPDSHHPDFPYASFPARPPWFTGPPAPAKVVIKADLLPAFSVLSMVALLGIPVGWLWTQLAPPQRVRVFPNNELVPLQMETWHRFDALAIFALLGLAAGVVTGVVLWLLRERRGPVLLIAAVAGAVLAGSLAAMLGPGMFAGWRYDVVNPPALGDVIERAPKLESLWVLVAQPLGTAMAYGLLAAWNGRDDLGRRLG